MDREYHWNDCLPHRTNDHHAHGLPLPSWNHESLIDRDHLGIRELGRWASGEEGTKPLGGRDGEVKPGEDGEEGAELLGR